jgi:hypothetical protein
MTRHERRTVQYPARIHRKRLKRRRALAGRAERSVMSVRHMGDVLREYVATRPPQQAVRPGRLGVFGRVRNFFRKPTI